MKPILIASVIILAIASIGPGKAASFYANSAGGSGIQVYETTTGAVTDSFIPASTSNGRGVVRVGDIVYYTEADSSRLYSYNIATRTSLGTVFTVPGSSGLATIAYDGASFYFGDYSGTNKVYKYSPTGALLQTITLSLCSSYCDGLEYANGTLISNRADGGNGAASTFDVYDLNGAVLKSAFITTPYGATGIAYDGADYYVSDIFGGKIDVFGPSGGSTPTRTITLKNPTKLIEDLSFDYSIRADTGGTQVPEPASLLLIGIGLAGIGFFRRGTQMHATA